MRGFWKSIARSFRGRRSGTRPRSVLLLETDPGDPLGVLNAEGAVRSIRRLFPKARLAGPFPLSGAESVRFAEALGEADLAVALSGAPLLSHIDILLRGGVPLAFYNCAFRRDELGREREAFRDLFRYCSFLSVRDRESLDAVRSETGYGGEIHLGAESAFSLAGTVARPSSAAGGKRAWLGLGDGALESRVKGMLEGEGWETEPFRKGSETPRGLLESASRFRIVVHEDPAVALSAFLVGVPPVVAGTEGDAAGLMRVLGLERFLVSAGDLSKGGLLPLLREASGEGLRAELMEKAEYLKAVEFSSALRLSSLFQPLPFQYRQLDGYEEVSPRRWESVR